MKNIILVSHYSGTPGGPVDKLYDFLEKDYKVFNIKHPLVPGSDLNSSIASTGEVIAFKIPVTFQYFLEGFYTLFYWHRHFKRIKKIDLVICFDSLSFFHFFILKKILGLKKTIYYSCDYSQKRFSNRVMNFIYRKTNLFAYKKCDYFFSLSAKFIEDIDPLKKMGDKNYIISGMVNLADINRRSNAYKNSLVYAGALGYGSIDFDPLLLALKKLKDDEVVFKLDIYGKVNSKINLRKKIEKLKLTDNIHLRGILENKILVQYILPRYQIGLAPYVSKKNKAAPDHAFLGTDLTAKLVDYIAAGLPVISTQINNGFKEIEKKNFGLLAENANDWYRALKLLLTNKKIRNQYKLNALKFAKKYDISLILNPIFKRIWES